MKLSVIIPCKNEVGIVDKLLSSLANQIRLADEIIVVDSHSSDGTAEYVRKVGRNYHSSSQPPQKEVSPKPEIMAAKKPVVMCCFFRC
jgi:glycosyltransferase involved in cell wall biosynthesis